MSSFTSPLETFSSPRIRWLVWPREHGAWGMLLIPLVAGGWVGLRAGHGISLLVFFGFAALALFCLRTPLEAWLETSPLRAQTWGEKRAVAYSMIFYASIAGVALAVLWGRGRGYGLLILAAVVAATFVAQAVLRKLGRETRMMAQLIGALGLTSTAAGAYYVVTGRFDSTALTLWAANWLFAANQIHFVQLRIRAARAATRTEKFVRGRDFLVGEAFTALLVWLAWRFGSLPGLAGLAFGPVLLRGLVWFFTPRRATLDIHRLGLSELVHALAFGVLFILGFLIYR